MTEEQADEAHAIWVRLHDVLNSVVFAMLDSANLTLDQEDYIINKLHEEHRYWRN